MILEGLKFQPYSFHGLAHPIAHFIEWQPKIPRAESHIITGVPLEELILRVLEQQSHSLTNSP
jgi:hypothetical protein